jgi:transcriptional regulator GlxA family with amidase domain
MEEADAKWEAVDDFKTRFPDFQLEDELFVEGGRDVMVGKFYQRRGRTSG